LCHLLVGFQIFFKLAYGHLEDVLEEKKAELNKKNHTTTYPSTQNIVFSKQDK
jgi:hypothetical protein